jgi:3-methyl-2-oxobutanoate hydroxymethyltransferase
MFPHLEANVALEASKVTAPWVQSCKTKGHRLTAVTAYDATFARLLEEGGAEILLVGDSLGMVVQGRPNTLSVTLDEMIYHCRAVSRGARRAQVVCDLPFMSYQVSAEQALVSAGRAVKEGSAEAVKLEGGVELAETVRRLTLAGIPVMGHVGLTPQAVHRMGGFRVQGRDELSAARLLEGARALEQAGAYAVVVEGVPSDVAGTITQALSIPTIGIGAGPQCDGQVLVCYDLLGLFRDLHPKFVKRYAELGQQAADATAVFVAEVRSGAFPTEAHAFAPLSKPPPRELSAPPAGIAAVPHRYGPAGDES